MDLRKVLRLAVEALFPDDLVRQDIPAFMEESLQKLHLLLEPLGRDLVRFRIDGFDGFDSGGEMLDFGA